MPLLLTFLELLSPLPFFSGVHVPLSLVFWVMFGRSFFVLSHMTIIVYVLRFTPFWYFQTFFMVFYQMFLVVCHVLCSEPRSLVVFLYRNYLELILPDSIKEWTELVCFCKYLICFHHSVTSAYKIYNENKFLDVSILIIAFPKQAESMLKCANVSQFCLFCGYSRTYLNNCTPKAN